GGEWAGHDLQRTLVRRHGDQYRGIGVLKAVVQRDRGGPDVLAVQPAHVDAEVQLGRLVGDAQRLVEADQLISGERPFGDAVVQRAVGDGVVDRRAVAGDLWRELLGVLHLGRGL